MVPSEEPLGKELYELKRNKERDYVPTEETDRQRIDRVSLDDPAKAVPTMAHPKSNDFNPHLLRCNRISEKHRIYESYSDTIGERKIEVENGEPMASEQVPKFYGKDDPSANRLQVPVQAITKEDNEPYYERIAGGYSNKLR